LNPKQIAELEAILAKFSFAKEKVQSETVPAVTRSAQTTPSVSNRMEVTG